MDLGTISAGVQTDVYGGDHAQFAKVLFLQKITPSEF